MSRNSKSLLRLLQRCIAVKQVTLPAGVTARGARLSGFIQQRTWTSASRTGYVQSLCRLQPAVRTSQLSLCTKATEASENEYPPPPACQSDSEPEKKKEEEEDKEAECSEEEYPPLPTYESELEKKEEVYIVQVNGLPWSCSAQDLLNFFSDCRIRDGEKGIHLTLDRQGRPSGRAFIEMEHEEDVSKALEKHRKYLGPRYVEVNEVTNGDAEMILKKAIQAPPESKVVRLRGIPFTSTEDDIAKFFSGLDIMKDGITIITDNRGRNSGEAFVQFSSQEAADEALLRDRDMMGPRYIEVFPSRTEEILSSWRRRTSSPFPQMARDNHRTGPTQSSDRPVYSVHMRGLPFQVSGEDIVKFFAPLGVSKILMECGPSGRPTGEADVYFSSHQEAVAAMGKDRMYIGERYVELFLNSVPDFDRR